LAGLPACYGSELVPEKLFLYLIDHDYNPGDMNADHRITIKNFQGTIIPIRRLSSHKAEATLGVATASSSAKF